MIKYSYGGELGQVIVKLELACFDPAELCSRKKVADWLSAGAYSKKYSCAVSFNVPDPVE